MRPFRTIIGSLATIVLVAACASAPATTPTPVATTPSPVFTSPTPTASQAPLPSVAASPAVTPVPTGDGSIVYQGPVEGGAGIRIVGTDGIGDHWSFPDVTIPKDGWQAHPDWSPDGTRLAFAADDPADPLGTEITRDLWVGDPDGSNARRVFDCAAPCIEAEDPAWSPDGRTLAFATWGPQPASLALLDLATGSVSIILTIEHGSDGYRGPRWSPDGRRIVLEHQTWTGGADDRLVDTTIGIVDLDAKVPEFTPLTKPETWATYPDWHPTDDRIVFSTRPWTALKDGPSNLYTILPDGSGLAALTTFGPGETRAVQPTWLPDGSGVIFTAVEGTGFGDPTMAVINADGSGLRSATTSGPMFGTHPRLRPTP